ncbi:MAG: hypothetical protein KF688_03980 [Pirellulales bacterium]|nr:hypothetical protein [Pirellulales bacterium]MBX3433638.1 hypothetical protein [Pirellulales bacterium]
MVQFLAALTMVVAVASDSPKFVGASHSSGKLQWISDYGQALEATRRDERPLLVVLESPRDEEKALDDDVLAAASDKLLSKYDLCRVDATTSYGKQVAESFRAKQLPHVAIIDKSGSVVLHKQAGQPSAAEFKSALEKHQLGLRSAAVVQTSYFRGDGALQPSSAVNSPGYCPSCQRAAMGLQ